MFFLVEIIDSLILYYESITLCSSIILSQYLIFKSLVLRMLKILCFSDVGPTDIAHCTSTHAHVSIRLEISMS